MEDRASQDVPENPLEFRLPDLGEGLADAELVSWSVRVGDTVELNQTIAEVETAKAVVSLPSPFTGRVVELLAEPGDTVAVGAALIRVDSPQAGSAQSPAVSRAGGDNKNGGTGAGGAAAEGNESSTAGESNGTGRTSVLVGYGPEGETTSRRRRPEPVGSEQFTAQESSEAPRQSTSEPTRAAATPAARKLAREIGIDLWYVAGSGPDGAVTVDDVRGAVPVTQPHTVPGASEANPVAVADPNTGDIRPSARETRIPIIGIRKRTAAAMVSSARTIPQASTSVTLDFTASMELLDHLRSTKSFTDLALTPLALVAKAVLAALAEFPGVNASWDEANQQIVTKHYVNLGIAVATDRGLLVPNIKDANALSLRDLCREIAWLADTARSGNASPTDLRGGSFTITNVGVFGVDTGIPLVNPGEAGILCLGSISKRPWVFREELAIRWVTTLSVTFDHRLIDGEHASRFLSTTATLLEDPLALLSRI